MKNDVRGVKGRSLNFEYRSFDRIGNCVKNKEYVKKIVKGESYIFRVYKPQRCTLEIERTPFGNWRINQLKLRKNESPRPETKNYVQEWLDSENQKSGL